MIIGGLVVLMAIAALAPKKETAPESISIVAGSPASKLAPAPSDNRVRKSVEPVPTSDVVVNAMPAVSSPWEYWQNEDQMTSKILFFASVNSTNVVDFAFPYSGPQHADLIIRTGQGDSDVLLIIKRGQFICPSYDGCSVKVRFDDEQPLTFSAVGPENQGSTTLFLSSYSKFYSRLLKAKRVRISPPLYQESAVFEFDVSGFDPKKYKPAKKQ